MPNTYTELLKTTVGTATPSITFDLTGISGYTDLVLIVSATNPTNDSGLLIRFNSDSGSNYSDTSIYGNGSSAVSFRASNATGMNAGRTDTGISTNIINIQNYANTTTYKTVLTRGNDSALVIATVGLWRNTAAITSITVYDQNARNFSTGSTFSLYGIANADQGAAKATGGIITEDSQYWYHTFAASGTFTPKQSLSCDVLAIAGGGGGGGTNIGGGGGAGGLVYLSSQSLTATGYTCTVGSGGTGGAISTLTKGTNGVNSQFGVLTAAVGGGGGGASSYPDGLTGGSGGGASNSTSTAGSGTSGQGFAGGSNLSNYGLSGGGGGGAGAVGEAARLDGNASTGGVGTLSYSSWGLATGTGHNINDTYYYAGGGACGAAITTYNQTPVTIRSFGGGGCYGSGLGNGLINTGSGGTGSSFQNIAGGSGGSGLIIVRYAK